VSITMSALPDALKKTGLSTGDMTSQEEGKQQRTRRNVLTSPPQSPEAFTGVLGSLPRRAMSKDQTLGEERMVMQCLATGSVLILELSQLSLTAPLLGEMLVDESASFPSFIKVSPTTHVPLWITTSRGATLTERSGATVSPLAKVSQKVFAADPWHEAQPGSIKNLKINVKRN